MKYLYNLLIIIAATGYVVFGLGYSGWWFVFSVLFLVISDKEEE